MAGKPSGDGPEHGRHRRAATGQCNGSAGRRRWHLAGPLLLSVPEALAGERVDRALSLLAGVSRASASRMVAEGRVRVGGSTVSTGGRRLRTPVTGWKWARHSMRRPKASCKGKAPGPAPPTPEAKVVFVDRTS